MANYFYVCTNGSFTGTRGVGDNAPYTTAQTGTMASLGAANVYPSLAACLDETKTAPPKDGDFVMVASDHDVDTDPGGNIVFNNDGDNLGDSILTVLSVDVTDITKYLPGAREGIDENNDSDDWTFDSCGILAGVSLMGTDNVVASTFTMRRWRFQDLTLSLHPSAWADISDAFVALSHDGGSLTMLNVDLDLDRTTKVSIPFTVSGGSELIWRGGAILNSGGTTGCDYITPSNGFGSGGGAMIFEGVDLSKVTVKLDFGLSSTANCDNARVHLINCQTNSGVLWPHSGDSSHNIEFLISNSDDPSNDRQHRFMYAKGGGHVINNDSVYVTNTTAFREGSVKSSLQVITDARVFVGLPFDFKIPTEYIDLSVGTTDKVQINICTDFTLTDKDIYFYLAYPDGTQKVQTNWLSQGSNVLTNFGGPDPHPSYSGTTLNTTGALTAADWTGEPASPNFYMVEFDTSTDAGGACIPEIRCQVFKQNIDGSTGNKLYIDSEIQVAG